MKLGRIVLRVERVVDLDDQYQVDAAYDLIETEILRADVRDKSLSLEDPDLEESDISADVKEEAIEAKNFDDDVAADETPLTHYVSAPADDPTKPKKGWATPATPTPPRSGWSS